jgi:hypothetical protein
MAKFNLNGLMAYLQGKGWKVKLNENAESEEETFEILEESPGSEVENDDTMITAEEMQALKGFAQTLAKNGKLTKAIEDGTLDTALETVPAAASLVKQNALREKAEKDSLIATIKTNSSNTFTDEELEAMPNPSLIKLNAQMNVSYLGMGGSAVQNAEQPLVVRPILLAQAEEANNGS